MKFSQRGQPATPLLEQAQRFTEALSLALRSEISSRGFKLVEVGRRLGVSGIYVSQLLRGNLDLRWVHVLDTLRVLGTEPGAFVARLHPASDASAVEVVRLALLRVVTELGVSPPAGLAEESVAPSAATARPAETAGPVGLVPGESLAASRRISQALHWRMRGMGVFQRDLAGTVDLTESYLGKLLRGDKPLKIKHFYACCLALEVEPGVVLSELWPVSAKPTPEERISRLVDLAVEALDQRRGGTDTASSGES